MSDPVGALRRMIDAVAGSKVVPASVLSAAYDALAELERRQAVEARLERWQRSAVNAEIVWKPSAERAVLRWETEWETHEGAYFGRTPHAVHGDGPDYWTAATAALDAAGAEP